MALNGIIDGQTLTTFVFYVEFVTAASLSVCDQWGSIMEVSNCFSFFACETLSPSQPSTSTLGLLLASLHMVASWHLRLLPSKPEDTRAQLMFTSDQERCIEEMGGLWPACTIQGSNCCVSTQHTGDPHAMLSMQLSCLVLSCHCKSLIDSLSHGRGACPVLHCLAPINGVQTQPGQH